MQLRKVEQAVSVHKNVASRVEQAVSGLRLAILYPTVILSEARGSGATLVAQAFRPE